MSAATFPARVSRRRVSRAALPRWRCLLLGGCLVLAQAPLLIEEAGFLWQRPHYQYFPIVLAAAGVFGWQRMRECDRGRAGSRRASAMLWTAAWIVLALAMLGASPWLGAVAALVLLLALLYTVGGAELVRGLLPVWLCLWLAVPLPLDLDAQLITALQPRVTWISSRILDLLEVAHLPHGNVLAIEGRQVLVEQACSGIQSLYALFACGCLYMLWLRRPVIPAVLFLGATVVAAFVCNVARVVGVVYMVAVWGIDVEQGWRHEAFGLLVFAAALAVLWSLDRLLYFFWHPAAATDPLEDGAVIRTRLANPHVFRGWSGWSSPVLTRKPLLLAYGVLACIQLVMLVAGARAEQQARDSLVAPDLLKIDALPVTLGGWERQVFTLKERSGLVQGAHSRIWCYESPIGAATVAVDGPFAGWHCLEHCYEAQGWATESYEIEHSERGEDFVAVTLRKPLQGYGYLWYCLHGDGGEYLPAPPQSARITYEWQRAYRQIGRWWPGRQRAPKVPVGDRCMQVQLFMECAAPLSQADQARVRDFYLQFRAQVAKLCRPSD